MAVVLAGIAATRSATFAVGLGAGSRIVDYVIEGQGSSTEWEVGEGTFDGTTGLTRDLVYSSSNANARVSFSVGTKDVFVTLSAKSAANANTAKLYAVARGFTGP